MSERISVNSLFKEPLTCSNNMEFPYFFSIKLSNEAKNLDGKKLDSEDIKKRWKEFKQGFNYAKCTYRNSFNSMANFIQLNMSVGNPNEFKNKKEQNIIHQTKDGMVIYSGTYPKCGRLTCRGIETGLYVYNPKTNSSTMLQGDLNILEIIADPNNPNQIFAISKDNELYKIQRNDNNFTVIRIGNKEIDTIVYTSFKLENGKLQAVGHYEDSIFTSNKNKGDKVTKQL